MKADRVLSGADTSPARPRAARGRFEPGLEPGEEPRQLTS